MVQYILMAMLCLGIIGLDQFTKLLVVQNIPLHTQVPVWDGIFHFTYIQNTGAAFSSFEGQHWLFVLVLLVFAGFIIWEFPKKRMDFKSFERWMIVAIFAGGVGNMIDRLRLGYVVDMIEVEFMRFAVFNVADIFITCGCVLLMLHLIFFNKSFWKEEKK